MVGLLKRETTWVGDEPQGKYPTPIYISCKSFPIKFNAPVAEQVDAADLKSVARKGVPVRVWLGAPFY